ncbi:MAG TPA: hypothetical protein DCL95_19005 [Rhodospirillaceae bacterium]|nr:hypothetical protein [Rhodospirillaceae bacterium]MAX63619.1 hypothetical protein [Rhodospirillaceae bacterium]MBB56683.1 hypothetical protein [Rhodospirillaceae bacterium]HAJ22115.1 hypothetical protein [Rhodospirillaceae bacterium]HBM11243.1 hypothetical protein [Rhodospirillaceae bacterium]
MQYGLYTSGVQSRLSRRMALRIGLGGGALLSLGHQTGLAAPDGPLSFLATVIAVDDGRSVRLTDGRRIIMPHILPPGPDRHTPMTDTTPIRQAAQGLADLVLGQQVRVDLDAIAQDRYGRLRARLSLKEQDVAALQARNGWVRVFPEPGADLHKIGPLLAAETAGRTAMAGFWKSRYFQVHPAESFESGSDRFEILSGRPRNVTQIGNRDHLEFGADWRTDFTAGLDRSLRKTLDPETLINTPIELRGWIRHWNGPFMDVTQPGQIRLL